MFEAALLFLVADTAALLLGAIVLVFPSSMKHIVHTHVLIKLVNSTKQYASYSSGGYEDDVDSGDSFLYTGTTNPLAQHKWYNECLFRTCVGIVSCVYEL